MPLPVRAIFYMRLYGTAYTSRVESLAQMSGPATPNRQKPVMPKTDKPKKNNEISSALYPKQQTTIKDYLMNIKIIEIQSEFAEVYLDEITVNINNEERLNIDNGRSVSKAIFLETEQILDRFAEAMINSGLYEDRDFDAAFLLGKRIHTDSKFRWNATRSLLNMAKTGFFQIECINPNSTGTKRYRIVPDKPIQYH